MAPGPAAPRVRGAGVKLPPDAGLTFSARMTLLKYREWFRGKSAPSTMPSRLNGEARAKERSQWSALGLTAPRVSWT